MFLAAGFLFFADHPVALAQVTESLDTVGENSGLSNADLKLTIASIIRTFLTILGIVAVCICLYGGFVWMTAGGEAEKVDKAKKILLNGVIGLAIILMSWAITTFIISALLGATGTGSGGSGSGGGSGGGISGGSTTSFVVSGFRPEGEVSIRNVQPSITLTKSIDSSTVTSETVTVTDPSGTAVEGTLAVSNKRITFTPSTACPSPNESRFCFEENTAYTVTVTDEILSTTGTSLDCSAVSCTSSFTTGTEIDTEDPDADLSYPDSGQRVTVDSSTEVQAEATDDSEVATADFAIDDVNFDTVVASGEDLTNVLLETLWYTDGLTEGQRYEVSVIVTDIAGNTGTDQVTVRATSATCDDEELNGDETSVDCGGTCGACDGSSCTDNADCASGYCDAEALVCMSPPEISDVTPSSGAPGTFVTITGTDFGTYTGSVFFSAADGATVEAELPSCSDGWSDTSIVVEVPETAVDGPITVTTNDDLSDATDDDNGLLIDDFDVNDVEHPNLCRLSPSSGDAGTTVTLSGTNFGEERDTSTVSFGSTAVGSYDSWSDTQAAVKAPAAEGDTYAVGMTVDGVESNTVSFTLTEEEEETPVISYVTPESGGIGQYVTIVGSGFGSATGSVFFISSDDVSTLASVDFPDECADQYWGPDEITVIVPDDLAAASYSIQVKTYAEEYSNEVSFTVDTSDPTPGICLVEPDSGIVGDSVTIYGEHLGSSGSLSFYNGVSATVATEDWNDSEIVASVPTGTVTGPVRVTVDSVQSNTENFEISSDDSTSSATTGSGYAWMFYTGELPDVPEVYVECSETRISGVPNNSFTSDGVCVNAQIFAEFSMVMDETTFEDGESVLVEECTDSSCETTTVVGADSGYPLISSSSSESSMSWLPSSSYNGGQFKASTVYRVTLTTDLATPAPNAANLADDVSWKFTTAATSDLCTVDEVRVSPSDELLEAVNVTTEFNALPIEGCVVLNASSYAWNWSIDTSYASIVEGTCEDTTSDSCAVATALAEGETDVTAAVSSGTEEGSGTLTINFTDPYVEQVWPSCDTACLDAEVGAQFNTAMDSTVMQTAGNVLLYECANELCASLTLIANSVGCSNADCSEIAFSSVSLSEDTYYKGVITGNVTSTSGVELTRPNSGEDYAWTFKTKEDGGVCVISRLELDPGEAVMEYIGQSQAYSVDAYGAPDDCSETGQRLSTTRYDWLWEDPIQDDTGVAEWFKVAGSMLDTNVSDIADGCTASCLPEGSTPYSDVCGDGEIGTGEDCDDGGTDDGDGCSSSCVREGGDGSYGTCGNGTTEQESTDGVSDNLGGEDCDDGNTTDGDGCSSVCTNEGSRSVGSTCGNSSIGWDAAQGGEDCDDGNRRSGDGCSSECLNEGTPANTELSARCGDGSIDDPYEACDDRNTTDGDGCSSVCLREGSAATYSAFGSSGQCGDGTVDQNTTTEAGEDCDDASDEGCSDSCTWLGSSYSYSTPSVCGDGTAGIGEVAICESSGGDANTDAAQVAFISDGAGDYVDLETHLATSTIRVEAEDVDDEAMFYLSCVADQDSDCPSGYGVNSSQCCEARPTASLLPSGTDVCRNAAIYGLFSKQMDAASFSEFRCSATEQACESDSDCPSGESCEEVANAYVSLDTTSIDCPEGYDETPPLIAQASPSWASRVWGRVWGWVTGQAEAAPNGCFLPLTGVSQVALSDGTYKVMLGYNTELEENATYTIHVTGDTTGDAEFLGVKSASGVPMDGDEDQSFTTGTEICTLDQIDIEDGYSDSPNFFSTEGETHDFVATPYSYSSGVRQEITGIVGVYDWEWTGWEEDSGDDVISILTEADNTSSIEAIADGNANIVASAAITTDVTSTSFHCETTVETSCTTSAQCPSGESCVGDTVTGDEDVTVLVCDNPWPDPSSMTFPLVDDATSTISGVEEGSGWMNFSTYYCKDAGEEGASDDYENVTVVRAPSSGSSTTVKEYLFQYGDASGDAIGVRVVQNSSYLSPMAWYQSQGFAGSPEETEVDGIQAVRDGRTVYVASPNVYGSDIYPNMYVISYNEGASEAVVTIFDQMISHFGFMTNLDDVNLCYNGSTYSSETCESDLDCDTGETCGSEKEKLGRDMERLMAITDFQDEVTAYGIANPFCSETSDQACEVDSDCPSGESCTASVPALSSGSYVRGLSSSAWPSWTQSLGEAFEEAEAIPEDPLSEYVGCGESPYGDYNADTCVNQSTGSYVCPVGSYVMHYRAFGPFYYQLGAEMEYGDADWAYAIDDDAEADGIYITVGGNASAAGGFTSAAAFCDGTEYGVSNACGDGVVGETEACEIGDTSTDACTTDEGVAGTIRTVCNDACSGYSTSTTASCDPNDCGDAVVQTGEDCDDGSLNGQYGYCGSDCQIESSFICGDGSVAGPEACDCSVATSATSSTGRTYGGSTCSSTYVNGTYNSNPNATCSWDCSGPASYCGDGAIDSGETCDGNTDTYSEYLCRSGSNQGEECTPDASGNDTTNCGTAKCGSAGASAFEWADACGSSTICLEGTEALLGLACDYDNDCGTDGLCSDAVYDLTRTKTCADDGADGELCTWNESSWKNIDCAAAAVCGDGTVDEGEECDDGNDDGTDECTTACTDNVCGDGYLYAGSEECDEGGDNGTVCTSAYGSSCTYCSTDCREVGSSGSFCGDAVINGDEYCDAGDIPNQYYSSTYHTVYGTCTGEGSSDLAESTVGQDLNEDGDTDDTVSMTCAEIGVCNGGGDSGDYCTSSSNCTDDDTGTVDGECVYASCAADCESACPTTFASEEVLLMNDASVGASRSSSLVLEPFDGSTVLSIVTSNAGLLYIPACQSLESVTVDIDDSAREYPDVDIVFVVDMSLTMDYTDLDPDGVETRLDIAAQAMEEAAESLLDAYDGLDADMQIGYVGFYGRHGLDGSDSNSTVSPSEYFAFTGNVNQCSNDRTITGCTVGGDEATMRTECGSRSATCEPSGMLTGSLTSDLASLDFSSLMASPSADRASGTPLFAGMMRAQYMLDQSYVEGKKQYIVLFSDGNVSNADQATLDTAGATTDYDGDGAIDASDYVLNVTNIADDLKGGYTKSGCPTSGTIWCQDGTYEGREIFTATLSSSTCDIRQMSMWSSMTCESDTAGPSCTSERNSQATDVVCDVGENGLTYAYSATTADGLHEMYQSIVDSIINITFTTSSDSETIPTTTASGNNRALLLPESFACDGSDEQAVGIHANFNGSGSITISGVTAAICEP